MWRLPIQWVLTSVRDTAFSLFVAALLPWIVINPVVGAYIWAWLSMMNPHTFTFTFARQIPFAQIVAIATLVGLFLSRKRYALPMSSILVAYIAFLVWMTFTSFFAVAPVWAVFSRWEFVMKIHVMLFVTLVLIRDRKHINILVWIITFSIAFYGIKGGIWTLLTGGGGRVWGPPGGLVEGNNELAVALVMLMPFLYYLYTVSGRWLRYLPLLSMAACAFAILGSQSRGALIALVAMAFMLSMKGQHPVRASVLLLGGIALAVSFMPESWTERMDTIGRYEDDSSAMSRIWAWKTYWAAALDNPIVGVGFVADNRVVFDRYAPVGPPWDIFAGEIWVAHSIYFQVLGEHGFVGLALFLGLGVLAWRTAGRIAREVEHDPDLGPWVPALMRMSQVSLFGYAVGGAFLNLAYFDWPYYVVGYVLLCDAIVRQRAPALAPTAPLAAHPPTATQTPK